MPRRIIRPGALALVPFALLAAPTLAQDGGGQRRAKEPSRGDDLPSRSASRATPDRGARAAAPRLLYGLVALPQPAATRLPYVDPADGELCIGPEALRALGVDAQADLKARTVTLSRKDSGRTVVLTGRKGPDGRSGLFVAARDAVRELGGRYSWNAATGTATVLSVLEEASFADGVVTVRASLPITPRLSTDRDAGLVVVDFPGAALGEVPRQPGFRSDLISGARAAQFDESTARLVLETKQPDRFQWVADPAGTRIAVGVGVTDRLRIPPPPPSLPDRILPAPGAVVTPAPGPLGPATPKGAPVALRAFQAGGDDTRFDLKIAASRLPAVRPRALGNRLVLDFANVALANEAAAGLSQLTHPLVRSATVEPVGNRAARLVLDVADTARYSLRLNPRGGLSLSVTGTPARSETTPLVGRTIVVDPGHGGSSSSGTRGVDGRLEKSNTLPMGLMLAEALESLGANVVVTRDCDADPGLSERGPIANRAEADLFVSMHCNDAGGNRAANGAIVYYHMNSSACRSLAEAITARMRSEVSAIRSQVPRSDSTVYRNDGFAVLRTSQMAGVLVEAGFMSNAKDAAALRNPEIQRQIAQAVARGIVDFLEANPDLDTRNVKPQKPRPDGLPAAPGEETEPDAPPTFIGD